MACQILVPLPGIDSHGSQSAESHMFSNFKQLINKRDIISNLYELRRQTTTNHLIHLFLFFLVHIFEYVPSMLICTVDA